MESTALTIAMEAKTRSEVLEERFDRHMIETKDQIKNLAGKVDIVIDNMNKLHVSLSESIHETRLEHVKDDKATNIKIYTVNGLIASLLIAVKEIIAWAFSTFKH